MRILKKLSAILASCEVFFLASCAADYSETGTSSLSIALPGSNSRAAAPANLFYYKVGVFTNRNASEMEAEGIEDLTDDSVLLRFATQFNLMAIPDETVEFSFLPEGIYKIAVTAFDFENNPIGNGEAFATVVSGQNTFAFITLNRTQNIFPTDIWYGTPVNLDGSPATSSSTYVYFGVFPRTVLPVADEYLITAETVTMGANTYYKGSDGYYYARCAENAYGTGDAYTYTDGTQAGQSGVNYRYFRVEPIKWKVLSNNYNGKALLLAEEILTGIIPYYSYSNPPPERTVGAETGITVNNYKYSYIRAYLNGLDFYNYDEEATVVTTEHTGRGFLQTAFNDTAQGKIAVTEVNNSLSSTGDETNPYTCANTNDKIFLLSKAEASDSAYGFSGNSDRIRNATDYATANHAEKSDREGFGGGWRLRTPDYSFQASSGYVYNSGTISTMNVSSTDSGGGGVVPALTISLGQVSNVVSGEGVVNFGY